MNSRSMKRILSLLLACAMTMVLTLPVTASTSQQTLTVTTGVGTTVNGLAAHMTDVTGKAVGALYYNGTTYVPIRALGETLDQKVSWNAKTSSAEIGIPGNDAANDAAYLQEYFHISPMIGTVTWATWTAAMKQIGTDVTASTSSLTPATAAKSLVTLAKLTELAENYTDATATATCKRYGTVSAADVKYVACALDMDLIPATVKLDSAMDGQTASVLLMNAVETAGLGRNYLGFSSDSDIAAKLVSAWNSFILFDDATLSNLGAEIVKSGATTGFGLKYDGYSAHFLSANTIQYAHDDITHAVQLMGLLKREGLDAKVQLEPNIGVYEYLLDWSNGSIPPSTPTYEVRKVSDNLYLSYSMGYDLELEFATTADRDAFDRLIIANAKKTDENSNGEGMIYKAWWQPLYSTQVSMPSPAYEPVNDVVVRDGSYSIHPFATDQQMVAVKAEVAKDAPSLSCSPQQIWVNAAFYRYLTDQSYQ